MNKHAPIRLAGGAALLACLAAAGCATTSPGYGGGYNAPPPTSGACHDCGTVTRIEVSAVGESNVPNATGAILGGVLGAAAAREIAKRDTDRSVEHPYELQSPMRIPY